MTIDVATIATDGTRTPLACLGPVGDLKWTTAWPTGCLTLSCTLGVPTDFSHPGLTTGLLIEATGGGVPLWTGVLSEPKRGIPWQLDARGLASDAESYIALGTTPDDSVDQAITRGLRWYRPATLGSPTLPSSPGTVADHLNLAATTQGQRWGVFADRNVIMAADPTTPAYLVVNQNQPGGRSIDDYATNLYGRYLTTAGGTAIVTAAGTTGRLGRVEKLVDLTPMGPISSTVAQGVINGKITLVQPRASFTGSLDVADGEVLDLGGMPIHPATIRPGRMVRLTGTTVSADLGDVVFGVAVDIILGQVDYDATTNTAQLAPLGIDRGDLSGLLQVAAAQDTSTGGSDGTGLAT